MRFKFLFLLMLLIGALTAGGLVSAQQTGSLILWVGGDLYRVTDSLTAELLTDSGTISSPALSPSGEMIAYKQAAAVGIEALDRVQAEGEIADIDLPADIAILNLTTGTTETIAGQPDNASLFVEGTPDNAVVRSAPAWSPDGGRLAWTEFPFGAEVPRLVIYDPASASQTVIVDAIPVTVTQGTSPEIRWGADGFAVNASTDSAGEQAYLIYGEDGALRAAPRIAPVSEDYVLDFFWVYGEANSYLGLFYASGRWTLLDAQTGVGVPFPDVPHLISRANPDTSLRLRFDVTPDMGMFWEALDTTIAYTGAPSRVTLSPMGESIGFIGYPSFNAAAIWQADAITPVANTGDGEGALEVGAILWGATMWRANLP